MEKEVKKEEKKEFKAPVQTSIELKYKVTGGTVRYKGQALKTGAIITEQAVTPIISRLLEIKGIEPVKG